MAGRGILCSAIGPKLVNSLLGNLETEYYSVKRNLMVLC